MLLLCVTHFNDPTNFIRCFESIKKWQPPAAQSHVLVIDDHSAHDAYKVIRNIISAEQYVYLIQTQKNTGPSGARNLAISYAIANGFSYISFIDGDDEVASPLMACDYQGSDITIFSFSEKISSTSIEKDHLVYAEDEISTQLKRYLEKPNKEPHLTRCWAKIYRVQFLHDYKISFDERMRTYEDIRFLMTCLSRAQHIKSVKKKFYQHHISNVMAGATFASGLQPNSLFSFLALRKPLRAVLSRYNIPNETLHHYLACYYSISLTRLAARINSKIALFEFIDFVRRRIRSPFFRNCFKNFKPDIAGVLDREALLEKICCQDYLHVAILFIQWSRLRYG